MMYLSRVRLRDASGRAGYELFERPYRLHQEVWELFADDPDRLRDFLYRLDQHHGRAEVLTLSQRPPREESPVWKVDAKRFEPRLQGGDLLRFNVRVNPIVTRAGKRHDVVMNAKRLLQEEGRRPEEMPSQAELVQEQGLAWLERRAEQHGFELLPETVRAEGYRQHAFPKGKGTRLVRLATCDLSGVLRVREPEPFLALLEQGLGPAKGFGCGLMLVARARGAAA